MATESINVLGQNSEVYQSTYDKASNCIVQSLLAAAGDVHNLQQQCPHNVHKT